VLVSNDMKMHSNTMFITGGGSGIGKGLAEAFHKLGNKVIIAGRREDVLKNTCAANPGMSYTVLDVAKSASMRQVAESVTSEFPALNCVINNAGIQKYVDFSGKKPPDEKAMQEEIDTNLLGTIRGCAAFLPHLRSKEEATIINVSSGLALVPMSIFPVYCATKAAVHSFCMSLRHQLRDTKVKVIELIPPYVATDLGGPQPPRSGAPTPMPLSEFIAAAIEELTSGADEVAVGPAKTFLAAHAGVKAAFAGMNR
jgi:uncharacterized oxidoreductase